MIKTILFFIVPAYDKLKHLYLWSLLFFGAMIFVSDWRAYLFAVVTAAGKEIVYDKLMKKGNPELKDFLFGILIPSLYMIRVYLLN